MSLSFVTRTGNGTIIFYIMSPSVSTKTETITVSFYQNVFRHLPLFKMALLGHYYRQVLAIKIHRSSTVYMYMYHVQNCANSVQCSFHRREKSNNKNNNKVSHNVCPKTRKSSQKRLSLTSLSMGSSRTALRRERERL